MQVARWFVILAGLWVLYHYSLAAFGGRDKLWAFGVRDQHRYTSMAMLTGTLHMRRVSQVEHDEQAYNGATYTNWGFGVPLLEMPFHAAAARMPSLPQRFFPDHAIYFSYLMAMIALLWAGFGRLLSMREPFGASRLRRHFLSWAATGFVLITVFFPLMASRFEVYEETLCYFGMAELLALVAYVFALRSWSSWAVIGLGAAAGLGLLVRPTGLIYLGMWTALVLFERRTRGTLLAFGLAAAPFLIFWSFSNWVRTGSPVGLGLNNSMPWFDYHTPVQRFGSLCPNTPAHAWQVAERLFGTFFTVQNVDSKDWPWLDKCHFKLEPRPNEPHTGSLHDPLFGVIVLVALAWMLLHHVRRRESRLALYVPYAGVVVLFMSYVWAGAGFAWRYVVDFWPAIVLAVVQYVRILPREAKSLFGYPLGLALLACSGAAYDRSIRPNETTQELVDERLASTMWADFSSCRWGQDQPLPSSVQCSDKPSSIFHDRQGWKDGCKVDTFTNLFIGVPYKVDDRYQLKFKTEGFDSPTLRVYLNGTIYTARRSGDGYLADVSIHYASLTSPTVMTTIEWTRDFDPPPGKFLSIELS
jgi:hypothetical protein